MWTGPMRILIADDHEMIRRGVRSLLQTAGKYDVCGEAVDGYDAIEKAKQLQPDLVLMDISMPNLNGLEAARQIRLILPKVDVIILSQHKSEQLIQQAIGVGARAYVDKSSVARDLLATVESVGRHDSFLSLPEPAAETSLDVQEIIQRTTALEQELRETEDRFRATFEQAAVGLAHVAPDGRWLRVNHKFCEIAGYTSSELTRLTVQDLTHKDDLAAETAENARVLGGTAESYSIEKRFVRKDGNAIWVSRTVSAVRDTAGQLKYLISSVEDITERKLASDRLRASQERLALAQRAGQCGTFELHVWKNLNVWSREIEELYGMEPGEFGGTQEDFISCVVPEDRPIAKAIAKESLKNGEFSAEFRIQRRRDGQIRWVSAQGKVLYDEKGKPEILIGINVDITERKLAAQEKFRLAAIVESSDDAIISDDLDGIIIGWNTGAQRLFGYAPEEALGQPINIIIPPECQEEERQVLNRFREGERIEHRTTIRRRKDGSDVRVSLTIFPVQDSGGRIVGVSKIVRDITKEEGIEKPVEVVAPSVPIIDSIGQKNSSIPSMSASSTK
jgi:PAS domain S-box-containing protein